MYVRVCFVPSVVMSDWLTIAYFCSALISSRKCCMYPRRLFLAGYGRCAWRATAADAAYKKSPERWEDCSLVRVHACVNASQDKIRAGHSPDPMRAKPWTKSGRGIAPTRRGHSPGGSGCRNQPAPDARTNACGHPDWKGW